MKKTNNFVKYYREGYDLDKSLQNGTKNLLKEIVFAMDADNTIMINVSIKKRFASKLETTTGTISDGISKLKKNNLITAIDTGYFMVNPYYCAFCLVTETEKLRNRYTKLKLYPPAPRKCKPKIKEQDVPY